MTGKAAHLHKTRNSRKSASLLGAEGVKQFGKHQLKTATDRPCSPVGREGLGRQHVKTDIRTRHFLRSETGSVAVEFAIVFIPLILFIIGSIETARYFWINNAMEEIASSTSRCMALRAPDCSADGEAVDLTRTGELIKADAARMGINLPDQAITLEDDTTCSEVDGFSSVKIDHNFSSVFALYPNIPIQVSACFPNQLR